MYLLSNALCQCGMGPRTRGDGRLDPSWELKKETKKTWALDGLPPDTVNNARSLAGQIMADAKHGRAEKIAATIDAEKLDAEQSAVLLAATDLANGNTALMLAAKNGHAAACKLLIERGADPAATNRHGQSATDVARIAGHVEMGGVVDVLSQKMGAFPDPPGGEQNLLLQKKLVEG